MDSPFQRFDQFELSDALLRRLHESGHEVPSHIQCACIPPLLAGRDLLAETYTGAGKTLAFVLPVLQTLALDEQQPQVLVLTPSDKVSLHVAEVFQSHARYLPDFHVMPINHQSAAIQARQMRRGVQVIVGTPRRILHHIGDHGLVLDGVRQVVLDEADEMLREGFGDDIRAVLGKAPAIRQRAIFAAAIGTELRHLAHDILLHPLSLKSAETAPAPPSVRLRYWQIGNQSKLNALARLIEIEPDFDAALVFVHDTASAIDLAEKLSSRGYAAMTIDRNTKAQLMPSAVQLLEQGRIDLLIGTDHAAGNLRLDRITHVVSYDMPCDAEAHVRRIAHIGNTGHRATAILLVTPPEMGMLHSLEHATRQTFAELELPERVR